ncbi:MAG: short-chain dehydrogenase, partial [Microthrixaceae bacterium]|nr:short-chain dehydrogenase [Microthrixaceae bacterium]
FYDKLGQVFSDDPPAQLIDEDSIQLAAIDPGQLADQVVYAINQPWGISISDITIRASNDDYIV